MTPAELLTEARAAGVTLWADGDALRYRGPQEALAKLLPALKPHKRDILAALTHPDPLPPLWWRVSILDPGGRTVEVDTPSGWTLADWQAYAERYHGPGCDVRPIAGLPKPPGAPVNLDEALTAACEGVAGITPAEFRALLSPEDVADIAAGGIHRKTVRAYTKSFAEVICSGRIVVLAAAGRRGGSMTPYAAYLHKNFKRVARLLEFQGGLPKAEAILEGAKLTAGLASSLQYSWTNLREALGDYPDLGAQIPDKRGKVEGEPLGAPAFILCSDGRLARLGGPKDEAGLVFPSKP